MIAEYFFVVLLITRDITQFTNVGPFKTETECNDKRRYAASLHRFVMITDCYKNDKK